MKTISKLLLLLTLILVCVVPQVAADPVLKAEILRYEPVPAQPGQYVTVYIELENTGSSDAPRVALEVLDQFPFTVVGENMHQVGTLKSQQSVVEEYRVRVGSEAVVGTNTLKVRFISDTLLASWQETELALAVRSNDASLGIAQITTTPEAVVAGDELELTLQLRNTADVVLRNIAVELDLVEAQGTTFVDYPFIPSGSSAQKTLTKLNPGEVTEMSFTLKAYPTATPGYYKLPLVLTFYDESGTETVQNDYAGLIVQAAPNLEVYFEDTTLQKDSEQGTVTLQFVNKGINDLKFLDIELVSSDAYTIVGPNKAYLGDLDSDDYRSETFTIKPLQDGVVLDLVVEYMDENNNPYSLQLQTPVRYTESAQEQRNSTGIIILVVVVLALLVWWWRRRHNHKK